MILDEVRSIINNIESELNGLDRKTKKLIHNNVYSLGNNYLKTIKESNRFYAFVVKKSFFGKMRLQLMSSDEIPFTIDSKYNYKIYKNKEKLDIFDEESLVKIKYFLISFATLE